MTRSAAAASRRETALRLVEVFQDRPASDWPKLLAASSTWVSLRNDVFNAWRDQCDGETNVDVKLRREQQLAKLRRIDREVEGHKRTYELFLVEAEEVDWEGMMPSHRPALSEGFFEHARVMVRVSHVLTTHVWNNILCTNQGFDSLFYDDL